MHQNKRIKQEQIEQIANIITEDPNITVEADAAKTQHIHESGLSRIYRAIQKHDFGIITASRYARECGAGERYTSRENRQRNASLFLKLRALGYGVTAIRGKYIENHGTEYEHEVGEDSFVVVDLQNRGDLRENLLKLGEEFEQDSILYGEAGGPGVLIGTNHCPSGPEKLGYHQEKLEGGTVFGKSGEFMNRVRGRPFVFGESLQFTTYGVAKFPTELRAIIPESRKHWSEITID